MTTYKILLKNRTKNVIYYKVKNLSDTKEQILKLSADESKQIYVDSSIINLFIYRDIEGSDLLWNGTTPTNVTLDIFEEDCGVEVYLDNNKLPSFVINNSDCKRKLESCETRGCKYYIVISLIILMITLFIYLFYIKK
jgi:hypothetical protein